MASTIRSLVIKVGADLTEAQKGFKKLSRDMKRSGRQMQTAGKSLSRNLTLPLLAAGGAALKLSADFDKSLAKVETIVNTNTKSMMEFRQEVLDLSDITGTSATEVTEALYEAISAGADTADVMKLMETAVKSAKGGFTDTTTAVDGLTSVLNAYNMQTQDADKLANLFFITQKKGKTTFGELAASIGNVAPIANATGLSVESLLASVAVLTANGQDTATAMTNIKGVLTAVLKPTAEASAKAKELGIDFSATALESKGLAGFLEDVKNATGGNVETMTELFGNVRALNGVLTLTSDGGMQLMNDTLDEMQTNTTAVDDAFNIMNDTVTSQMGIALNSLKNVGIQLGSVLMPILTNKIIPAISKLAENLTGMIDGFSNMSDIGKNFVSLGFVLAAAMGPILIIVGKLNIAVGLFLGRLAAASAATGFKNSLLALLGPAGAVVAVVGVLALAVAGIAILYNDATKESREYNKEVKKLIDETNDMKVAHKEQNKELSINKELTIDLTAETLRLGKMENRTATETAKLTSNIKILEGMHSGLNLEIDETTGLLIGEKKAIKDVITAMLKQADADVAREQLLDRHRKQIELNDRLETSTKKVFDAYGISIEELENLSVHELNYLKIQDAAIGKNQGVLKSFNDVQGAIAENAVEYDDARETFENLTNSMETNSETVAEVVVESSEIISESIEDTTDNINQHAINVKNATEQLKDSMGGIFDKFEVNEKTNKKKLFAAQKSQLDGLANWDKQLKLLEERANEAGVNIVDEGLIKELRELGPKSVTQLKIFNKMTDKELQKYQDNWHVINSRTTRIAADGMEDTVSEVRKGIKEVADEIKFTNQMKINSVNIGRGINDGVRKGLDKSRRSMVNSATRGADAVMEAMRKAMHIGSPSKLTEIMGKQVDQGFSLGMLKNIMLPVKAAKKVAMGALSQFQTTDFSMSGISGISPSMNTGGLGSQGNMTVINNNQKVVLGKAEFDMMNPDVLMRLFRELEHMGVLERNRIGGVPA